MFVDQRGNVTDDGSYVLNGRGSGPVGNELSDITPNMRRPFLNRQGVPCVTLNAGVRWNPDKKVEEPVLKTYRIRDLQDRGINSPVFNSTLLPLRAWIEMDAAILRATRKRLRAWTDLASRNRRGGFDAMSHLTLEYQTITDAGEAQVDMDGLSDGRTDRSLIDLRSIPLPITHSDFWFSKRELLVSRNTNMPLDTTAAEQAGRRVAETIEKTVIGLETGMTFGTRTTGPNPHLGTSTVYGYTNFPSRITLNTLHNPSSSTPDQVNQDVLGLVALARANNYFGPYMLYTSTGYDQYLDADYYRTNAVGVTGMSLRQRIMNIKDIEDIRRLDYLTTDYQMILVQMDPDVAQAIDGMAPTTVQWESQGGMRINFKVMAIQVPLLRAPTNNVTGIVHATSF